MFDFSIVRCPHLKVEITGALCVSEGKPIKDIDEANIKFCMCKNYERCFIYHMSLGDLINNSDLEVVTAA